VRQRLLRDDEAGTTVCCDSACPRPCYDCDFPGSVGTCVVVNDPCTTADGSAGACCNGTCCVGQCCDTCVSRTGPNNCRACGGACAPGESCGDFGFSIQCYCFLDSSGQPHHCPGGQTCSNGTCCGTGLTGCDGTCTSVGSDPANCGACGHACGGGTCVNGSCVCNPGYTACNGACVDLQSDPTNCGACGYDCDANTGFEGCRNGACCFPNGSACFFVGPDATCCSGQCGHFGESYASCG